MSVVASRVEPRLVERRRQVAQAASRRRRRRVWSFVGLLAVVATAVAVVMSPLLDIDLVTVTGNDRLDSTSLIDASGLQAGSPMALTDLETARRALLGLPWVESVHVSREWPSTVHVAITEQTPAYFVSTSAGSAVVSGSNRVIESTADNTTQHPELHVDAAIALQPGERVPEQLSGAMSLLAQMSDALGARVERVDVGADGAITLDLVDDVQVAMGTPTEIPAKLLATETLLTRVVTDCMQTVDVREPKRPTVSRLDGCDTPPPTSPAGLEAVEADR